MTIKIVNIWYIGGKSNKFVYTNCPLRYHGVHKFKNSICLIVTFKQIIFVILRIWPFNFLNFFKP